MGLFALAVADSYRGEEIEGVRPRFFVGAAENPFGDPFEWRPLRLAKKARAGADFIQTQMIYNAPKFREFMKKVVDLGTHEETYILAGVGPLKTPGAAKYMRDKVPGFTGVVSDLGGPTANMYRIACKSKTIETACRRPSCVYPGICSNLKTDHAPLIRLYRRVRELPGIKKVLVASGLRYDLAVHSPEYVRELVTHHVGGYLKIAPEHTESGPLSRMMKPGMDTYYRFKELFDRYSQAAGKKQYLIPYFIAAHPGTSDEDMLNLALWLKRNGFRADQVQSFLPSPMASATAMYHSGRNPLRRVGADSERVSVPRGLRVRRLHKAFLRYHDANNWPLLRQALKRMGRADLIGNGKRHLIPRWQPKGSGAEAEGQRRSQASAGKPFRTQHSRLRDGQDGGGRKPGAVKRKRRRAY
mgnify:CR=1 FL=1